LSAEFLKRRLLLRPLGNVVYFMPPYVVTETECEWVLDEMRIVLSGKLR
jgi:adenosylmethionine-8-amino-7-oxononanoate aminotransferase